METMLSTRVRDALAAIRGVFANPDIRRVQFAFAGSVLGLYAYVIAVSVYAYHHGGATAVGVFLFVRLTVAASVAPFAASFADRFRRERVMVASDLVRVVTVGAAALAAMTGAPAFVVYGLAILTTTVGTVFRPAEAALLPTLARSPEELTAANVSSSTFDSVGSFAGPALGALLLVIGGPGVVFCLTAAAFAWSALLLARVHGPERPVAAAVEDEDEGGVEAGMLGGLRAVRAEPRLRLLIGLYSAQNLVAGALNVLIVAAALGLLAMGNSGVGLLEATSGVGSLLGAGVALALIGRRRLASDFGLGIVLWGAPLVLLGVAPHVAVALVALAVVGAGNSLVDIAAMTLLQRTAPPEVAGRVFGVLESMCTGALGLGGLLAGVLISTAGTRATLIGVGAFLPVVAALCWRRLSAIDRGAAIPTERLAVLRHVPFLASLPLSPQEFLAERLVPGELAAGEVLFERGAGGDRFAIVTGGAVAVELPGETKVLEAPCYVGEIALLRDVPRTATVRAVRDSELWSLERGDFLTAVAGHARSARTADDLASARLGVI